MTRSHWLLSTVSVVALVAALPTMALAADPYSMAPGLPAVSAPNGKVGTFIGSVGGDFTLGANGSFAIPLSSQWGAQIDGMFGTAGGGAFYGVGGHLFWRDPAKGLLGVYASYVGWGASSQVAIAAPIGAVQDSNGADVGKIGVEGEAYLDRISLEGVLAYQYGSHTGFAGKGTIAWYATDNLRFDAGVSHLQGLGTVGSLGAEWSPMGTGMTLFVDGAVGANSYWHALGGVKVYFGGDDKSLIRRHREDDPDNILPDDLYKAPTGAVYCPTGTHLNDGSTACVGVT